jgi:ADP-ribosylglycohydrolase
MFNEIQSAFRGCFYGLAIGDALGYPVEFLFRGRFVVGDTHFFREVALGAEEGE